MSLTQGPARTSDIIALQGAASFVVQAHLAEFARFCAGEGAVVAGCVEEFSGTPAAGCAGRSLRDIATGRHHVIGQDLGPGSLACHLDASGVAEACRAAIDAMERGCDLVVLAKFGKLEAERSGLVDAFATAVSLGVPVVTSVAPRFSEAWEAYAGDLATTVEPSRLVLENWWRALRRAQDASHSLRMAG